MVLRENSKKTVCWLALDKHTREIVGVHIGKRDANAAQALWNSIPKQYREKSLLFTDFREAYQLVFPEDRHIAVGK